MRPVTDLRFRLGEVTGILSTATRPDNNALVKLEKLLVQAHIDKTSAHISHELSVERASWYSPESLSPERWQRIDGIVAEIDSAEPPKFRVFRREASVNAATLDLATPAWGRGAAISQTIGPINSLDGRRFWYDFYPIVRLVPVHFAGDSQPALLFQVTQLKLKPSQPFRIADVLRFIRNRRYTLSQSSIWIRANLLAPTAPAGSYIGLRVRSGSIVFASAPIEASGKLTIPAGGQCSVALNLLPAVPAAPATGKAGIDASKATLALPDTFSFVLKGGKATVTKLADAKWKLYGQGIGFSWKKTAAPSYEPELNAVLVPCTASVATLNASKVQSPFGTFVGKAAIATAGWSLPVATIDISNPTEAAGNGGLAVQTAEGLTLDWRGLRDGPVRLPSPWVALAPGLIFIVDATASNLHAHQRFLLWKDADSKFRSELNLRYSNSFLVMYLSASAGNELLLAQAAADAQLDRPVDVSGTPLQIRTLGSLLALSYSDAEQFAFLYDDNILVDGLDPTATWPVEPGKAVSLAIRNALFTVTPVNSLLMFAKLRDEEAVEKAKLLLGMGLFGLLPTLPDPYAANVGWLRRSSRGEQRGRRPSMLLVGGVDWTKAADDNDPDTVETDFAFAPLGTQEETFAAWSQAAKTDASYARRAVAETDPAPPGQAAFAATRAAIRTDDVWDRYFGAFTQEQFALLDVSSNADQVGVSFAWFNTRSVDDSNYTYYALYRPQGAQTQAQSVFPLHVRDLDLSAESRFVRAFTVPQISWEPLGNLTPPAIGGDPPFGWNFYPNDGGPTRLFNDSVELVPIAPIPVTEFFVEDFEIRKNGFSGSLLTLPFGLKAFAEFSRVNQFVPGLDAAKLGFNRPEYATSDVRGGLQLRADAPKHPAESPIFKGGTLQLGNVLAANGGATGAGTLGASVGIVFNNEFFYDGSTGYKDRGVPLTRIDFSGYGASIFSHWQNPNAAIAATSQAHFDVFVGRTAHEVVQVRSLVYPWGVRVVRTITIFRASNGYPFRFDTGWQAESDGVYDFSYRVYDPAYNVIPQPDPYEFHPGIVKGVFKVRNIRETNDVPNFRPTWNKANGESYVDDDGILRIVDAGTPANERSPSVDLQPLYFDADVEIEYVASGATGGRVPSKGMLGYVQLAPRGEPLSPALFADLLNSQFGAIGGPVDCIVDIGNSKQLMRLSRVDVNVSTNGASPIFASAARGAVVLPKDGSWSVVQHNEGSGEVSPVDPQATVPLIRRGKLNAATKVTDATVADLLRLANPIDLVRPLAADSRNYGLLQSTGTQKALFRRPSFQHGLDQLLGATPDFADAYRILNSSGIFPNVQDALPLAFGAFKTQILAEGYKLLDQADPAKAFTQLLPDTPIYLINEEFLKLYVEYAKKDKHGNKTSDGKLDFGFDATAANIAKKWLSKVNDIGMVVDLGPFKRLMMIKGKFNAEKGTPPAFIDPELEFGDDLKPVVDILQVLLQLQGGDYANAMKSGLEIAMSNSAGSWNYAFTARKEIPVVKFPPGMLYDQPTAPLKLECHLGIGVYFNEVLKITDDPKQLIPSVGAFLEFGGRLSVMCVSLAAATIYATGSVELRTAADIKTGPSLHMKFGFGAEIVVGLPVVGNVSLLYMVGIEIDLETSQIVVAGFLLFRGRVELLGGIVTVTVMIEAKGSVKRTLAPPPGSTDLIAQITFGLDISIFLVINLHFSQSWQEQRQIA